MCKHSLYCGSIDTCAKLLIVFSPDCLRCHSRGGLYASQAHRRQPVNIQGLELASRNITLDPVCVCQMSQQEVCGIFPC